MSSRPVPRLNAAALTLALQMGGFGRGYPLRTRLVLESGLGGKTREPSDLGRYRIERAIEQLAPWRPR